MSARHRHHKRRIREMQQSAEAARTLLQSYDAVIADMQDAGYYDHVTGPVRSRRHQLDSDLQRLRGEIASLERAA